MLNEIKDNPERKRLKKQFNNFGKENLDDFNYFISKIKKANLITLNIGANFLLPKIPIDKFVENILKDNDEKNIFSNLKKIIYSVKKDVITLLNRLKELNNDCLIYLVGYNKMYGPFWEIISKFLKKIHFKDKDIIEWSYDYFNLVLKECAIFCGVYYISTNNEDFWKNNSYSLSNIFYEIHPTIKGYKKIAQDVFAKICLSNLFFNKDPEHIIKKIKSFNLKYLKEDKKTFKNGINFKKIKLSDNKLINVVFGKNDNLLWNDTNVEKSAYFLENNLYFEQPFDENNQLSPIKLSIIKSIYIILNYPEKTIDQKLINDLEYLLNNGFFKEYLNKTFFFSKLVNQIQFKIDDFYKKNNSKLSNDDFFKIFIDSLFKNNFLHTILLDYSKYLKKKKDVEIEFIKKILIKFLSKIFLNQKIKNFFLDFLEKWIKYFFENNLKIKINANFYKKVLNFLEAENFSNLLSLIINFYFDSIDDIFKTKSFKSIILLLLDSKKIDKFLRNFFTNFMKNIKINDDVCLKVLEKLKLSKSQSFINAFKMFFNDILIIIQKNDFFIDIFIYFIKSIIKNNNIEINLQFIIDYLFSLGKNNFWIKLSKLKIIDSLSKKSINNLLIVFDLIISNLKNNSMFFTNIFNLTNPKGYINDNNKIKTLNLLNFIDKLNVLKKPLSRFFSLLLNNYILSTDKTNDNIYYKNFFRVLLILLIIFKQLFQSNINKNIFMNKKISIVKIMFSIAGYKNDKKDIKTNIILNMFNEDGNYDLKMVFKTNKKMLLELIYFFD